jgi:hypothetical protein
MFTLEKTDCLRAFQPLMAVRISYIKNVSLADC